MTTTKVIEVEDSSRVSEARRVASSLAASVGLDEEHAGRAALVASEMATNLVKFAKRGQLLLRSVGSRERTGVELASVDTGPGMSVSLAMRDGYSTAGSRGVGMGAISRASTVFDVASWAGVGTFVLSQIFARSEEHRAPPPATEGAVCVPYPGETVSGDAWSVLDLGDSTQITVVDGLGHGMQAADAAQTLLRVVQAHRGRAPQELLDLAHPALKSTRGAAAAVARVPKGGGQMVYAGVGNIAGDVLRPDGSAQSCVSQHGIVGGQLRKVTTMTYDVPRGSLVVLASDGLSASWKIEKTPGLRERHPALVAAALYALYRRGRDDATAVVHRTVE